MFHCLTLWALNHNTLGYVWLASHNPKICPSHLSLLQLLPTIPCSCWFWFSEALPWSLLHSSFHLHQKLQMRSLLALSGFFCLWPVVHQFLYVHLESTNTLTLSFFPFFVFTSVCTFNSFFSLLLWRFGIIYLLWEFTWEISCTMSTQDCCQNPFLSCYLHYLIFLGPSYSSLSTFLCSLWWCVLPCHIWNTF